MAMVKWLKHLVGTVKGWLGMNFVSAKSGKPTKRTGKITAFGEIRTMTMPLNDRGGLEYTLEEIQGMAIRCAWCGKPIFIGECITLLTPAEKFEIPDYAVVHNRDPMQLVGCLRWDCAPTGALWAGYWVPDDKNFGKGKVLRILSPLEQIFLNLQEGNTDAIIVGEVGDPSSVKILRSEEESGQ
jgi:hypothetical protein